MSSPSIVAHDPDPQAEVADLPEGLSATTADALRVVAPDEWRLTKSEAAIFAVLLSTDVATKGALLKPLYGDSPAESTEKSLKVFMHSIRRKTEKLGVKIKTIYAVGYALDGRVELIESLVASHPRQ